MTRSLWLLLTIALALAGCQTVRYELRPPPTEVGRLCVTECAGVREACRGNELDRARVEKRDCERRTDREVHNCLSRADSPERRKDCERMRSGCWIHENTERCEGEYRSCYSQCGGRVIKVVEEH